MYEGSWVNVQDNKEFWRSDMGLKLKAIIWTFVYVSHHWNAENVKRVMSPRPEKQNGFEAWSSLWTFLYISCLGGGAKNEGGGEQTCLLFPGFHKEIKLLSLQHW